MKNTSIALSFLALTIVAGCNEKARTEHVVEKPAAADHDCVTTGPNSPIVTGANSVVVINERTYAPGHKSDCATGATSISTQGAGSPIVTGAGAKVSSVVEQ